MKIPVRFAIVVLFLAQLCAAQELTVAAAADLQFAMKDIAARFQKQTGARVNVSYGSSGNFYQQLQNGAPFDLFFSANLDYAKKLQDAGLVEPGSYYEYAQGKLVLWVRSDSKLDLKAGLKVLQDPSIKKIAIANPQHAPYGQAAVAALRNEKIYDQVAGKLVLGENISQTASYVVAGSADVGIVALSLAKSPGMKDQGRYVEIAAGEYPPIRQACVILRDSKQRKLAQQFENFIQTPEIRDLLTSYGFAVPSPANK